MFVNPQRFFYSPDTNVCEARQQKRRDSAWKGLQTFPQEPIAWHQMLINSLSPTLSRFSHLQMIAMDAKTEIQSHHSTPATGNNGNQQSSSHQQTNSSQLCAGCGKHIQDRFLLRALDLLWHEDCLKCGCCDCRLGEVGSTLYTKGNLMLCKRDYLRLFGNTGFCAACNKVIPAFEMVMRARSNVYHLECFACQQCNHRWDERGNWFAIQFLVNNLKMLPFTLWFPICVVKDV